MRRRLTALVLVAGVLALTPWWATAEDEKPTLDQLKALVDGDDARSRSDAAEGIAVHFYDPDALVPWLRKRIDEERNFHVRLALAYAIAAQGEKHGLQVLIDALEHTGHLGYVYLTRVSEKDFGGPGKGWNQPAWVEWLDSLAEDDWRELQRKKHLPREAKDDDATGLAKAIEWWNGLGFRDLSAAPFVRVYEGSMSAGGKTTELYDFAFLLKETRRGFTVFSTDLSKLDYVLKKAKNKRHARFEKVDLETEVRSQLDEIQDKGRRRDRFEAPCQDPFGVDFYFTPHRHKGLVLAVALCKCGAENLALRVWKHIARKSRGGPRHGRWSGLELVQNDVRAELLRQWETEAVSKRQTWRKSLAAFKAWRARVGSPDDAWETETEALLTTMASEERRYKLAALGGKGSKEERAGRLVLALPTVKRESYSGSMLGGGDRSPKDAASRLVGLGTAALPALITALDDRRFTKTVQWHHGGKAYLRVTFSIVRVQELALRAIREIAQRDFGARGATMEEVRLAVEAWWEQYQTLGESGVLIAGVEAADASSPAQARVLVERYPDQAFAAIHEAIEKAEGRVVAELISTLAVLEKPEVREFLEKRAREGHGRDRIAAAGALHAQGSKAGVACLLADWPTMSLEPIEGPPGLPMLGNRPVDGLVEHLFELEPIGAIARMRETLQETPPAAKYELVNKIHAALGYQLFFTPNDPPARRQPAKVRDAAEALLVDLVLDVGMREGKVFAFGPGEPGGQQTNRIGEAAAKKLAHIWPDRYSFDPKASFGERTKQRYDIVNAWRHKHGLEPVEMPKGPTIKPVSAATLLPLLEVWRQVATDEDREKAESAIVQLGLGTLPVLKTRLAAETDGATKARLDLLVRRVAAIVREVYWSTEGQAPNAAMRALVDALKGVPIRGRDITNLFRQCDVDRDEGTTGIDITLDRAGDDTGYVMKVAMTTHRVHWPGGEGGFILSGDGQELVDSFLENRDSWWHESRGSQLDKVLHAPAHREVHLHRSFVMVK